MSNMLHIDELDRMSAYADLPTIAIVFCCSISINIRSLFQRVELFSADAKLVKINKLNKLIN